MADDEGEVKHEQPPSRGQVRAIQWEVDGPSTSTGPVDQERVQRLLGHEDLRLAAADKQQLQNLVEDFHDVFALDDLELGHTDLVAHTIDTGDHCPIRQPPRRIPFALRSKVEEMVQQMLEREVIQPSHSPVGESYSASGKERWEYTLLCRLPTLECSHEDGQSHFTPN